MECIKPTGKTATMAIVKRFHNTVFLPGIGCIKTEPVKLAFEKDFKPIQPPRRGVPYHYQERLADHLELMEREGAIKPIDPREEVNCTMNVVITDKKSSGQIYMNIDTTPINAGIKMTKYHFPTAGDIRHTLEGAPISSELDMGDGFHQVPLHPATSK